MREYESRAQTAIITQLINYLWAIKWLKWLYSYTVKLKQREGQRGDNWYKFFSVAVWLFRYIFICWYAYMFIDYTIHKVWDDEKEARFQTPCNRFYCLQHFPSFFICTKKSYPGILTIYWHQYVGSRTDKYEKYTNSLHESWYYVEIKNKLTWLMIIHWHHLNQHKQVIFLYFLSSGSFSGNLSSKLWSKSSSIYRSLSQCQFITNSPSGSELKHSFHIHQP